MIEFLIGSVAVLTQILIIFSVWTLHSHLNNIETKLDALNVESEEVSK